MGALASDLPQLEDGSVDALACPEGTLRVLLFRAQPGTRKAAGLLDMMYWGPVVSDIEEVKRYALKVYGAGDYRVVLQERLGDDWRYSVSIAMSLKEHRDDRVDVP